MPHLTPETAPLVLTLCLCAAAAVFFGLRQPAVAMIILLGTMFLRLALPHVIADPFVLAFAGLLLSFGLWLSLRPGSLPHLGWLEGFMGLYLFWNLFSMIAPHKYAAWYPLSSDTLSVYRFILTGTAIPFACYVVGRTIYRTEAAVRGLLWSVFGFAAYSGMVSVLQFAVPSLVWPRYIVDDPLWPGRANGVFNQPVVNGLVLIAGFVTALMLIRASPRAHRWLKWAITFSAVVMVIGIYLTHTRAIWLSFVVIVIAGIIFGKRVRSGFAITMTVLTVAAITNWSRLTSSDRDAGGVGSTNEVDDRLNSIATSLWAAEREPIEGWGIGRFTAVNSLHHQQWSQDVAWDRGLGISSHFNELGILVELGAIGLILWLVILTLLIIRLVRAIRVLPADELVGRNLGLLAAMLLGTLIVSGLTVDLRFFDFPNALVYLLVGVAIGAAERGRAPAADPALKESVLHA